VARELEAMGLLTQVKKGEDVRVKQQTNPFNALQQDIQKKAQAHRLVPATS